MILPLIFINLVTCTLHSPTGSFKGHTNVITSLSGDETHLYSSSFDYTIKQWDLTTKKESRSFIGHSLTVVSITLYKGFLYSASLDGTLRKWDTKTGKMIFEFLGHREGVTCFSIENNYMYSGSWDSTIRQWDLETGRLIRVLWQSHPIRSLVVKDGYMYAGIDNSIAQFNASSGALIRTLARHSNAIISLFVNLNFLYSSSSDGTIRKWDIHTGECVKLYFRFTDDVSSNLLVYQGSIFFGTHSNSRLADSRVLQIDARTGGLVNIYQGHTNWVDSLYIHSNTLYTGAWDYTILQYQLS